MQSITEFQAAMIEWADLTEDQFLALPEAAQKRLTSAYAEHLGKSTAEANAKRIDAPLADVADLLHGHPDRSTMQRVMNRVEWVTVPADDFGAQADGRKLIRANGRMGAADAQVYAEFDSSFRMPEYRALWDLRLDEGQSIVFRRWVEGGVETVGALWVYWESDLPETVPVYRADLDVEAVGPEAVRYTRNRMFEEHLHVPLYDEFGLVVTTEEADRTAEQLFEAGVDEVAASQVAAYRNQVIYAEARFASPEAAAEYRRLLEPYRWVSPREAAANARRKEIPGSPTRQAQRPGGKALPSAPAGPAQRRRQAMRQVTPPPAVVEAEAPRKGFFRRLLGG